MSSRRYVKRVWRVPKDRGALEFFATVVTKALVKHGWPARFEIDQDVPFWTGFYICEVGGGRDLPADFLAAVQIAAKIAARTYRVEIEVDGNFIDLAKAYELTSGGHLREIKG